MRHVLQLIFFAVSNGYWLGFFQNKIYQGNGKKFCLPGLNCYSCPGALGACPIGALQASLTGATKTFPFYALGFLICFGALLGRGVCAFLCPFGLVQDLLHKLKPKGWQKNFALPKIFRKLPYVIFVVFVILMPLFLTNQFGISSPAFCKYICPSGTFFGAIPLLSGNEGLRSMISDLFFWKLFLLIVFLIWSVIEYRPFCKYFCPLGAFYGLFHTVSWYRMEYEESACTGCRKCSKVCKMGIDVVERPNDRGCIRCGDCVKNCPEQALSLCFEKKSFETSEE
ncbi:MAG: 4Fe-4S binding protein [Bacillota bacterium]